MNLYEHICCSQQSKISKLVYKVALIAALSGLLFGYDTGVISGALLFIKREFALDSTAQELLVSSVLLGAIIGAFSAFLLADRFARRPLIIMSAVLFIGGTIVATFAHSITILLLGRTILGIAIGVSSATVPVYIAEISPARQRGALVMLFPLAITTGIFISYGVDFIFAFSNAWRWMFGLAIVPAVALGVGMLFVPESPRWLLKNGRRAEACAALARIRGIPTVTVHPPRFEPYNGGEKQVSQECWEGVEELAVLEQSLTVQNNRWRDLGKVGIRSAVLVGLGVAVFHQITGINAVLYYAPTIFQFAGFHSASAAILATVGIGAVNAGMTLVAMRIIDQVGRRKLLLWGLVGMLSGLIVLGASFQLNLHSELMRWVALVSLIVYVGAFAISWGGAFWVINSEIYPLAVRGQAMSLATIGEWGFNLVVSMTFLLLVDTLGRGGAFWVFACISVVAFVFTFFALPETKGKTLEHIESYWGESPIVTKVSDSVEGVNV